MAETENQQTEDLDKVGGPGGNGPPINFDLRPYDPRPMEDAARRRIAYLLIALLIGICALSFGAVLFSCVSVEDVVNLLQIILGPVVALVSAATGFYYGTKVNSSGSDSGK